MNNLFERMRWITADRGQNKHIDSWNVIACRPTMKRKNWKAGVCLSRDFAEILDGSSNVINAQMRLARISSTHLASTSISLCRTFAKMTKRCRTRPAQFFFGWTGALAVTITFIYPQTRKHIVHMLNMMALSVVIQGVTKTGNHLRYFLFVCVVANNDVEVFNNFFFTLFLLLFFITAGALFST